MPFIKHYQLSRPSKNNTETEKKKKCTSFLGSLHYALITPFDTIPLRSGFQRTIYDASKDILVFKGDKDSSALRGKSHIDFPTQRVIMKQKLWPANTPCHMRHFQNSDRIYSFLKPVFNVFILGNLIVRWNEGLVFCIKL